MIKNNNEDQTVETIGLIISFFVWFLFNFVFYYIVVFTIAVSCSFWYNRMEGRNYLASAYKWLFTSVFGSLVFGSAIIVVLIFAKALVDSKKRDTKSPAAAACIAIVSACLKNIQDLVEILNHHCVIVMAVTGQQYIQAAKTTIGILSRFLGLAAVSDSITGLLVFLGIVLITGITSFVSYFWLESRNLSNEVMVMLMIVSILGSIMISSLVLSVLVEGVSSVFVFYCIDVKFKELGHTTNNMPNEINEALGNSHYEEKK